MILFSNNLMSPLFSSRRSTGSGLYKFLFGESILLLGFSWKRLQEQESGDILHLRPRIQAMMDVMFPLEVLVCDSHYSFQRISPLHTVLLRNRLVVLYKIDL